MVSFYSKTMALRIIGASLLLGLLILTGCLCDSPNETDLPWNAPNERDSMIPLPSSMLNRYN